MILTDKQKTDFASLRVEIFNREPQNNFDHIIPLDLFGFNDPANIQLLCKNSNSEKLNKNTEFGTKYQEWFT